MIPIKSQHPIHTLTLPSTGKPIKFRPFVEKERKILLMTSESKEEKEILEAIKNVIAACCFDVDPNKLTTFDMEYIFLQLRAKSVGEVMTLNFQCNNQVGDKQCKHVMKADVDLTDVTIEVKKASELKIKLTDTVGVKLRYPTLRILESEYEKNSREYLYDVIIDSIEFIWEGENIYYTKDYSYQDTKDFIMSLTYPQMSKLEEFIGDLPVLSKSFKKKCDKCGFEHEITLEGYQSFFI